MQRCTRASYTACVGVAGRTCFGLYNGKGGVARRQLRVPTSQVLSAAPTFVPAKGEVGIGGAPFSFASLGPVNASLCTSRRRLL